MKVISSSLHRILDYGTVLAFAVAPFLVPLSGSARLLAVVLAPVHLAVTLATRYPDIPRSRPLSWRAHGMLEIAVGLVLAVLPFALEWKGRNRNFYLGAAAVFVIVWALTDWRERHRRAIA